MRSFKEKSNHIAYLVNSETSCTCHAISLAYGTAWSTEANANMSKSRCPDSGNYFRKLLENRMTIIICGDPKCHKEIKMNCFFILMTVGDGNRNSDDHRSLHTPRQWKEEFYHRKSIPTPAWNPRCNPSDRAAITGKAKFNSTRIGFRWYIIPAPTETDGFERQAWTARVKEFSEIHRLSRCCGRRKNEGEKKEISTYEALECQVDPHWWIDGFWLASQVCQADLRTDLRLQTSRDRHLENHLVEQD